MIKKFLKISGLFFIGLNSWFTICWIIGWWLTFELSTTYGSHRPFISNFVNGMLFEGEGLFLAVMLLYPVMITTFLCYFLLKPDKSLKESRRNIGGIIFLTISISFLTTLLMGGGLDVVLILIIAVASFITIMIIYLISRLALKKSILINSILLLFYITFYSILWFHP